MAHTRQQMVNLVLADYPQVTINYYDSGDRDHHVRDPVRFAAYSGTPTGTNSCVIDMGCGTGTLSKLYAEAGVELVIAVDIMPGMLWKASELIKTANMARDEDGRHPLNVVFVHADINQPVEQLRDVIIASVPGFAGADLVASMWTMGKYMPHVNNQASALRGWATLLNDGGTIAFDRGLHYPPRLGSYTSWHPPSGAVQLLNLSSPQDWSYCEDKLRAVVQLAGLLIVKAEAFYPLSDFDDRWPIIRARALLRALPSGNVPGRVVQEVKMEYLDELYEAGDLGGLQQCGKNLATIAVVRK